MSQILKGRGRRPASDVKIVRLKLVKVDFWSAVRMGFLIQLGLAIATIIGFFFLWLVLSTTGLFNNISSLVGGVLGTNVGSTLPLPPVMSFAGAISVFNMIVGTLLSGIIALVYNAIARLSGGLAVGFTNN
jgi:hypothetical protein